MEKEAGSLGLYPTVFRESKLKEHLKHPGLRGQRGDAPLPPGSGASDKPGLARGFVFWGLQLIGGPRAQARKGSGCGGQRAREPRGRRGLEAGWQHPIREFLTRSAGRTHAPRPAGEIVGLAGEGIALLPPVCLPPHPRLWVAPRTRPSLPLPPPPLAGSALAAAARPQSRERPAERAYTHVTAPQNGRRGLPRRASGSHRRTCLE